jgi:hypothetical protein
VVSALLRCSGIRKCRRVFTQSNKRFHGNCKKSQGIFYNAIISTIAGWLACKIISFETAAAGHISPLRTIIACAILTAEKLLENISGIDMVN